MSTFGVGLTDGGNLQAGANLTTNQFQAVKASTSADRQLVLASTGGEAITGILQNQPNTGEACEVCFDGLTKAKAGTGGWTAGAQLQTEAATGNLIVKAAGVAVAVAHEAAAAGNIGLVRIIPTGG